ncbi:hypothetical protein PANDA_001083, partial [Ailuropoda melanoleuca]
FSRVNYVRTIVQQEIVSFCILRTQHSAWHRILVNMGWRMVERRAFERARRKVLGPPPALPP